MPERFDFTGLNPITQDQEFAPQRATTRSIDQALGLSTPDDGLDKSFSLYDYAVDLWKAPAAGAEGFLRSIYGLADTVLGDVLPDEDRLGRIIGRTETIPGSMIEGVTQFMLGFIPVAGWIGRGANIGRAGTTAAGLSKLSKAAAAKSRSPKAINWTRNAVASGIADFAAFPGHEKRLSNLLADHTDLADPVFEFLAANDDDPEIVGRLKASLEGFGIGGLVDGMVRALVSMKKAANFKVFGYGKSITADEIRKAKGWKEGQDAGEVLDPDTTPLNNKEVSALRQEYDTDGYTETFTMSREGTDRTFAIYNDDGRVTLIEFDDDFGVGRSSTHDSVAEARAAVGYKPSIEQERAILGQLDQAKKGEDLETIPTEDDVVPTIQGSVRKSQEQLDAHSRRAAVSSQMVPPGTRTEHMNMTADIWEPSDVKGEWVAVIGDTSTGYQTFRIARQKVEGQKNPVWVDIDSGKVMGRTKAEAARQAGALAEGRDSARSLRNRSAHEFSDEQEALVVNSTVDDIRAHLKQARNDVNPRELDVASRTVLALEKNDLNLKLLDAEPAAVARTFEKILRANRDRLRELRQTDPKEAAKFERLAGPQRSSLKDPMGNTQLLRESMEWERQRLADMTDGDPDSVSLKIRADESLDVAEKFLYQFQSWRATLELTARDVMRRSKALILAGPDEAPTAASSLAAAELRHMEALRTLEGLSAVTGRVLQSHRIPYARSRDALLRNYSHPKYMNDAVERARQNLAANDDLVAISRNVKSTNGGMMDKSIRIGTELFINNILGGGKTLAINMVSGLAMTTYRPFEKMLGATITKDWAGIQDAVMDYSRMVRHFNSAMKAAWKATKEQRALLMDDSKLGEFSPGAVEREISAKNFGMNPDSGWGRMVDWMGKWGLGYPSAILTGTDEFIKNMNYQVTAESILFREGLANGKSYKDAAKHAVENVRDTIWNYQMMSQEVLEKKIFRELDPRAYQSKSEMREHARLEADRQWNSDDNALVRLVTQESKLQSEKATFTEHLDHTGGDAFERFTAKYVQGAVIEHPALRFFATFIRTPYNVLRWGQNRTFDPMMAISRYLRDTTFDTIKIGNKTRRLQSLENTKNKFLQDLRAVGDGTDVGNRAALRKQQDALGKLASGVGMMATFTHLAQNGMVTGGGPRDKEQRQILMEAGWQPYSIRVGDNAWIEYRRLDPIATVLGTVADMYEVGRFAHADQQPEAEDIGMAMVIALANNATNKTYMTGIRNLVEGATDPERNMARVLRGYASAAIPRGLSDVGKWLAGEDEVMKDVRTAVDALRNRVPYLGDDIDPLRNFMGEPIRRTNQLGADTIGSVANLFVPIAYRETKDNLIGIELATLKHGFSPPRRKMLGIDLGEVRSARGQSAYDRMLELRGEIMIRGEDLRAALRKLINSPEYQRMPLESTLEEPSPRIDQINRVVNRYHRKAATQMKKEFPDLANALIEIRRERQLNRQGLGTTNNQSILQQFR
mgnify:CR=1 FL=1|tara:strand:- start:6250 stop:10707 length:4458 start_codon:yes stop_codon:yes gene_type:complete